LYVSSRCTILFTARLLYHVVFESYKPFNGQGGVTTFAPHCTLNTRQRNVSFQIELHGQWSSNRTPGMIAIDDIVLYHGDCASKTIVLSSSLPIFIHV